MSDIEFELTVDNSDLLLRLMKESCQKALEAVGLQAEGHAKKKCPVDTGRLRNSITHTTDEEAAYIGTNVEYAGYVEYGTSRMKAQPYIRPAASDHGTEYKRIFEEYLKNF